MSRFTRKTTPAVVFCARGKPAQPNQTACAMAAGAALALNEAEPTRIARKARQGIPQDSRGVFFPSYRES
ncbi:MAG: hypothetical protein WBD10_08340 [Acidobacteriaceae bacterium]